MKDERRVSARALAFVTSANAVIRKGWWLLLLATSAVNAQSFQIFELSEDFDSPDASYEIETSTSSNAMAGLTLTDVDGSQGLIFEGTWDVPANGQEFASGLWAPTSQMRGGIFQWEPAETAPFAALVFQLDVAVDSPNMDPAVQGIFAQLALYQRQSDNSFDVFFHNVSVLAGESRRIDVVLSESDFVGDVGQTLDLSPSGGAASFGLQFGAFYSETILPDPYFLTGTLSADNWRVEVLGLPIFYDGFEPPVSASARLGEGQLLNAPTTAAPASPP